LGKAAAQFKEQAGEERKGVFLKGWENAEPADIGKISLDLLWHYICCVIKTIRILHPGGPDRMRAISPIVAFSGSPIMPAIKNKSRLAISLLLVLCLLPVVTNAQLSAGVQKTGVSQKTVLFTHAISGCVVPTHTLDGRANFNSFDGLSKPALILGQIQFDCTRESSAFSTDYNARFTHCADRTAIPIREPPFYQ